MLLVPSSIAPIGCGGLDADHVHTSACALAAMGPVWREDDVKTLVAVERKPGRRPKEGISVRVAAYFHDGPKDGLREYITIERRAPFEVLVPETPRISLSAEDDVPPWAPPPMHAYRLAGPVVEPGGPLHYLYAGER